MVDPDNIVLEHLRGIRAKLDDVERKLEGLDRKVDTKADAAQFADLELKLDGLTHMIVSSFGAVVHRLDSIDARVSRLERERV